MKRKLFCTIFSSIVLFTACGGSSDKNESDSENSKSDKGLLENISEATGTVKNISKLEQYAKDMEARINELKSKTPVSKEVLKSALPEEIANLKRTSYNVGEMSALSIASAKGEYKSGESDKRLSLEIMDGAGEAASGMASILFLAFQTDKDSESESGFEKTVDLNGSRALVKETTYNEVKNSEIQFIYNNRFIVTLKGTGFSYDELAEVQKKLNLSNLK